MCLSGGRFGGWIRRSCDLGRVRLPPFEKGFSGSSTLAFSPFPLTLKVESVILPNQQQSATTHHKHQIRIFAAFKLKIRYPSSPFHLLIFSSILSSHPIAYQSSLHIISHISGSRFVSTYESRIHTYRHTHSVHGSKQIFIHICNLKIQDTHTGLEPLNYIPSPIFSLPVFVLCEDAGRRNTWVFGLFLSCLVGWAILRMPCSWIDESWCMHAGAGATNNGSWMQG
jgi:hypothetical protein